MHTSLMHKGLTSVQNTPLSKQCLGWMAESIQSQSWVRSNENKQANKTYIFFKITLSSSDIFSSY